MSMFDANDLLDAEIGTEFDTEYHPVPEGEYSATITKTDVRVVGEAKDKYILEVTWEIDDDEARQATGMERPQARQSIWLDVDSNGLEGGRGKNVQLGKLREVLGQNGPQPWRFANLEGASAVVMVSHRSGADDRVYAEVKKVAAA